MQADRTTIFVAWDERSTDDADWGEQFAARLEDSFVRLVGKQLPPDECPEVRRVAGFSKLPTSEELSGTSVVLVVLPDRAAGFDPEAQMHLERMLRRNTSASDGLWEGQAIPIACDAARLPPPPPLDRLQGLLVRDLDSDGVATAAKAALINASLLLAQDHQGALFISYSHRDGLRLATVLEAKLRERGFRVFRDEAKDRDQQFAIPPGSETQKVIERSILERGFVLLLDTPAAERSEWVREEVKIAIGHLLPILPIVFPDTSDPRPGAAPPRGGRFRALRELDREVRVADETQLLEKVDEIENQVVQILLSHSRSRRRLIYASQVRFEQLQYTWESLRAARLHYKVEKPQPLPKNPNFTKRYVVGCSPYPRLVRQTVEPLRAYFGAGGGSAGGPQKSYSAAILVHGAAVEFVDDLQSLYEGFDDLLIVLRPHEITADQLPP